jgi:hypothetical protein
MKENPDWRRAPFRVAPAASDRGLPLLSRRLLLAALPAAGLAGCESLPTWLGGRPPREKVSPEAQRLVGWLRDEGRDSVLDPAAPRIMGFDNGQRDIPVRQLASEAQNGRHVVSLTTLRGRTELIFHRRQGDNLYFHLASASLMRQASATYPRHGSPGRMSDAYAENDYPAQAGYWLQLAERRGR